jgi:hypothetical protein
MIYHWNVYYNGEFMGIYRAMSSEDACDKAYKLFGSASAYTGRSSALFRAERIS